MYQFANLLRLNRPIGIFLLFWPCAWSLAMTQWYVVNNYLFIKYLILFFIGSVIMRSAGCVYNDIVDKKIDIKRRPHTAGGGCCIRFPPGHAARANARS